MEGNLPPIDLHNAPPLMPWRQFADWIRMADEHDVVWAGFATATSRLARLASARWRMSRY